MATTTNYSWTTPDDTALVKDGASAIRSLGTSVDTTTKALNPSTTLGDIEYRSSTANTNTRLGIGTTGQVLTVAGGVPSWTSPAGGGKVLQVVSTTYSTQATSSSGTYADTGVSLSITPSLASSKVLVLHTNNWEKDSGSGDNAIRYNLLRGATQIWESYLIGYQSSAGRLIGTFSLQYLDSPSTTSSTTYKTQFKNFVNSGTIYTQVGSTTATFILMEIGA